jgi:hypothetical protein
MRNTQINDLQGNTDLIRHSTYFPIIGYVLIALLVRIIALCPLLLLWAIPVGWSIKWLSILCPVLIIILVLPMRFSFARAMMTAAQSGTFSIWRALRLTQYRRKLQASLRHALRILCWGFPFLFMLGWSYYIIAFMDVFAAIRILATFGEGVVTALSTIVNFIIGIIAGNTVQWTGGFTEGLYAVSGIAILTLLIFLWGIWRCSLYRYLWATESSKTRNSQIRIRKALRGYRWKQFTEGLYNIVLWLPTMFFLLLIVLSIYEQIVGLVTTYINTNTIPPISFPKSVVFLGVIGLFVHLLILPVRRSVTADFINSIKSTNK